MRFYRIPRAINALAGLSMVGVLLFNDFRLYDGRLSTVKPDTILAEAIAGKKDHMQERVP